MAYHKNNSMNYNAPFSIRGVTGNLIVHVYPDHRRRELVGYVEMIFDDDGRKITREWRIDEVEHAAKYGIHIEAIPDMKIREIYEEWKTAPYELVADGPIQTEEHAIRT